MLVLSRKLDEKIVVGENVTITLLAIKGGRVQIGITAPQETRIVRAERRAAPFAVQRMLAHAAR